MIRTTFSFLVLFGSLLVVSKALTESQAQEKNFDLVSRLHSSGGGKPIVPHGPYAAPIRQSIRRPHPIDGAVIPNADRKLPGETLALVPSEWLVSAPVVEGGHGSITDLDGPEAADTNHDPAAIETPPSNRPTVASAAPPTSDLPGKTRSDPEAPTEALTGEAPAGEASSVEAPAGEAQPGEAPAGEASSVEAPSVEAQPGETSSGDAPSGSDGQGTELVRELSREQTELREKIRDVLAYHIARHESVERRSPWGIMHALIAYGVDTQVVAGGRPVNAIGWLCWNGTCRGQQIMYLEDGHLKASQGPGVQGHQGQFLAMLAQSRVKADFPVRVGGRTFSVMDLVEHEKETCEEATELTFKLIGLSHYLNSDAKWKNHSGQSWDIPKLIKEELAQPVIGAACGGTHRMMGFSYSVKKREKAKLPITGQWLRARKYVDSYHEYTFKLQNADGSFSTNWFRGPGEYGTIDRHLETTGHITEWMVYSLSDEELLDPRTIKAVNFLATMLHDNLDHEWEVGPKGHALHALAIYDERVYGGQPGKRVIELAERSKQPAAR